MFASVTAVKAVVGAGLPVTIVVMVGVVIGPFVEVGRVGVVSDKVVKGELVAVV